MKKTLVTLAILCLAGTASSQSSVTLFGVVDAGVSVISNKSEDPRGPTLQNPFYVNQGSAKLSRTELHNSGYSSSRIGFRGTEDLGGGLAANFWLEAPISNDDGATGIANFSRRSTVGMSGGFGEVKIGRDYTPSFWNDTIFDPFGTNGIGTNLIITAIVTNLNGGATGFGGNPYPIRASNSISYFLPPDLGGFYGQVMYAFHEQNKYEPGILTPSVANNSRTGRYVGGRFGYAKGALDIAAAYGNQTSGDQFAAGTTDAVKIMNIGASYDFGFAKLMGEFSRSKSERDYGFEPAVRSPDVNLSGYLVGVSVPVGAGQVNASYARVKYDLNLPSFASNGDPKADKVSVGYVYNLSKRTALYGTVARVSNKNGAALSVVGGPGFLTSTTFASKTSIGYDLGIRHAF